MANEDRIRFFIIASLCGQALIKNLVVLKSGRSCCAVACPNEELTRGSLSHPFDTLPVWNHIYR